MQPKNSSFSQFGQGSFIKQLPGSATKRFADFHGGHDSRQHSSQTQPFSSPRTRDMEVSNKNKLKRGPGVTIDETLVGHPARQMALHASLDFTSELVLFDAPYIGIKGSAGVVWYNVGLPVHANPWSVANFAGSLVFMNRVGTPFSRQPNSLTVEAHDTIPQGATVCVFGGRLFVGGAVLAGNLEPMGMAWSAANSDYRDFQSDGAGGEPLISDMSIGDRIVCARAMNLGLMAILCRRSIWVGTFTGDLFRPANFEPRLQGTGPINEAVVANTPAGVIYLGDQGVEVFDGNNVQHISAQIDSDLLPLDLTQLSKYSASYNIFTQRYTLHTPTQTWVFDLRYQRWYHSSIIAGQSVLFPRQFASDTWGMMTGDWNADGSATWADAIIREGDTADLYVLGTVGADQVLGHLDYASEIAFGTAIKPSWDVPIEYGSELNTLITSKGMQVQYSGSGTIEFWMPDINGDFALLLRQQLGVTIPDRTVWLPALFTGLGLAVRVIFNTGQLEVGAFELKATVRGPRIDTTPFYPREYYPEFDTTQTPAPADLPPGVPVPAFLVRADLMTDEQQGLPVIGSPYQLGADRYEVDIHDPSFDRASVPPMIVFGADDSVRWLVPVGDVSEFNSIIQDPTGFTIIAAVELDAADLAAQNPGIFTICDDNQGFGVSLKLQTAFFRMQVSHTDSTTYQPVTNAVIVAGRRVLGANYYPAGVALADKSQLYVDGVLAPSGFFGSAGNNIIKDCSLGETRWGKTDVNSFTPQAPVKRQFAIAMWRGNLTAGQHAAFVAWLHTLGF